METLEPLAYSVPPLYVFYYVYLLEYVHLQLRASAHF